MHSKRKVVAWKSIAAALLLRLYAHSASNGYSHGIRRLQRCRSL
jgi:hypothetical protein